MDKEPKIGWKTVDLTDEAVTSHLEEAVTTKSKVMLDKKSRWGKGHLRLYRDKAGPFVRVGRRGSCKQYLGRCKITYLDGRATLFQFTLADQDAFDAAQEKRWCAAHGIDQNV